MLVRVMTYLMGLAVYTVVTVGIWRSARHYSGPRKWAVLARVGVILSFVLLALVFILGLYKHNEVVI